MEIKIEKNLRTIFVIFRNEWLFNHFWINFELCRIGVGIDRPQGEGLVFFFLLFLPKFRKWKIIFWWIIRGTKKKTVIMMRPPEIHMSSNSMEYMIVDETASSDVFQSSTHTHTIKEKWSSLFNEEWKKRKETYFNKWQGYQFSQLNAGDASTIDT